MKLIAFENNSEDDDLDGSLHSLNSLNDDDNEYGQSTIEDDLYRSISSTSVLFDFDDEPSSSCFLSDDFDTDYTKSSDCDGDSIGSVGNNIPLTSSIHSTSTVKKSVQFDTITVREFSVIVGVVADSNVSCPIQLDWAHSLDDVSMNVSDHSSLNSSRHRQREWNKMSCTLLTTKQRRERIAKVQGISIEQVMEKEQHLDIQLKKDMSVEKKTSSIIRKGTKHSMATMNLPILTNITKTQITNVSRAA
jgi:hypothetical protein